MVQLLCSQLTGLTPYMLKIFFNISGDMDFDENPNSKGCFKKWRNSKHQGRKWKELISMVEGSKILLSENDSKLIYYAMKRLFFCCIRSSDEDTKMRATEKSVLNIEMEFDFEDISVDSETKIHSEALSDIHLVSDPSLKNKDLKRKPLDKNFKYDDILVKEGKSEDLEEELVKVNELSNPQLLTALNMIEGGSLTISDIFFNMRRRYQFAGFKLMLLNMLFWGSYKPLSALNNDGDILGSLQTQTLSIVI